MKEESDKKSYEDCSDIIDQAILRQKYKWRLNAVKWFDFDDVEQIIKSHIAKKMAYVGIKVVLLNHG